MFGQRELFHSNLLAWFFDVLPDLADQVFRPLTGPGDGNDRRVERERESIDLVLHWPGAKPLVIENKVFALPDLKQLDRYAEKFANWKGSPPKAVLLGMVPLAALEPGFTGDLPALSNGWSFLSYETLADRLDAALATAAGSYDVETMRHYARVVRLLAHLIATTALGPLGTTEAVWIPDADLIAVDASQDGQFRRYMTLWHLTGRSDENMAARAQFARAHPSFFDFNVVADALGVDELASMPAPEEFLRFNPDFVYRYAKVPSLRVDQLLAITQSLATRLT